MKIFSGKPKGGIYNQNISSTEHTSRKLKIILEESSENQGRMSKGNGKHM